MLFVVSTFTTSVPFAFSTTRAAVLSAFTLTVLSIEVTPVLLTLKTSAPTLIPASGSNTAVVTVTFGVVVSMLKISPFASVSTFKALAEVLVTRTSPVVERL